MQEVVEDLPAGSFLIAGGHHHKRRADSHLSTPAHTSATMHPMPRPARKLRAGEEERDCRAHDSRPSVCIRFDEAEIIGDRRCLRQKNRLTHSRSFPCRAKFVISDNTGLAFLPAGHGTEALAFLNLGGNLFARAILSVSGL